MDKLKIFSKKLGEVLDVSFGEENCIITPEGVTIGSKVVFAWNNSAGSWLDKGWNNSAGSWQDKGWSNSAGSWIDKGWSNSTGRWSDNGWSNSTSSWGDSGSSGSGCFVTSACIEAKGLADDCMELETLREYRDILVEEDEDFRMKILEYYRKAPLIVQQIEQSGESTTIYDTIYNNMIQPCVLLLKQGKKEEAKTLYLEYYEKLSERYLVS